MLVQESINTTLQLAVVLIVAGLVYLFAGRHRGNFLHFTGLVLPTSRSMVWALLAALVIVPVALAGYYFTPLAEVATAGNTVTGKLRAEGFSGEIVAVILLVALVKTSLTEEIFFRGLIAKRLIRWLGLAAGNTLQAAVFGSVHLLIFILPNGPEFDWPIAAGIFGTTAMGGWIMAYVNERVGNGSIAPGWLIHAMMNLSAYPVLAFG